VTEHGEPEHESGGAKGDGAPAVWAEDRMSDPNHLYQFDPSFVHRIWRPKLNAFYVVTQFVPGRIPGTDPS
jgi:hypothetical protein